MGDLNNLRNRLQKVIDQKSMGSHPTMLETEIVTALYRAEKCIEDLAKHIASEFEDEANWKQWLPMQHDSLINDDK